MKYCENCEFIYSVKSKLCSYFKITSELAESNYSLLNVLQFLQAHRFFKLFVNICARFVGLREIENQFFVVVLN